MRLLPCTCLQNLRGATERYRLLVRLLLVTMNGKRTILMFRVWVILGVKLVYELMTTWYRLLCWQSVFVLVMAGLV